MTKAHHTVQKHSIPSTWPQLPRDQRRDALLDACRRLKEFDTRQIAAAFGVQMSTPAYDLLCSDLVNLELRDLLVMARSRPRCYRLKSEPAPEEGARSRAKEGMVRTPHRRRPLRGVS